MNNKETTELSEKSHHLKLFLPKKLVECLPKCPALPKERLRWNTNEEIASYLITFERHEEWLSCSPKTRPQNGSIILYNRKKVKYRKDGYCWKKRKDGKTTREDHMKLKVQGMECLYGCYVHSSIVPTFHRRCYWLLQNPDIVLVHYLNVPALEDCAKVCGPILCSINSDRKEWLKWSKEELVSQLKPMFHGIKWTCSNGNGTTEFSIEQLVQQILESHQAKPPPRTHACLCSSTLGSPGHVPHKCSSTKHRIISPKVEARPCLALAPPDPPRLAEPKPEPEPAKPDRKEPLAPTAEPPSSSPDAPRPSSAVALSVGLPSSAVLVMTGLEKPLALTPSQHLVAGDPPGLALLPGPGLVLSQNLEANMETGEAGSGAFDPDCFLNSPARGQTYGRRVPEPPPAGNRFFIQDDGGAPGRGCVRPPSGETPMETGGPRPGGGAGEQLPDELYSIIQTGATGGPDLPFGLSLDSLISELMTEGAGAGEGSSPPRPALTDAPSEAAPPGGTAAPETLVTITDFSPDWSYPEGGVKVLITGPWTEETDSYTCLFDRLAVPATLIQSGVLRCYCPAHEAGLVALHVSRDARLVSASVLFEYRGREFLALPSTQLDWLSLDDNQFRMSILERLEQMEKRMAEMTASSQQQQGAAGETPHTQAASDSFEERIVALCEKMMSRSSWLHSDTLIHDISFRGMTLLHLAAAQGYARLIETLIKWRNLRAESLDLEQEVDPLNVDHFSCTPLMWACALGHLDAALLLYRWDGRALSIPDSLGRLPLAVARSRGHVALAARLEELQCQEPTPGGAGDKGWGPPCPAEGLRIPSPLSASPDTGLSTVSSVSSPSELSDGSGSVTSAYSSASALRDSPACSPEPEAAMDFGPPPEGWYLPAPPSPPGLRCSPSFFMDYEGPPEPELLAYGENAENEGYLPAPDVLQVDMITLAKQIIEATPEHIKQEGFSSAAEVPLRERSGNMGLSETMSWLAGYLENVDQLPSGSQHRPMSSSRVCLSPLQAPLGELPFDRLPPPSTAASWAEFLNASANGKMESEFALLTLSDHEQRELYEAARVIQTAFRKYKGRRLKEQQETAAAVIQRCYRKYKQYALYKKMTQAAILIQSKFRSYYEQKKFQQSRRAAVLIQQYYRSYKEYEKLKQGHRASATMQQKMKGTFLTKKQDQAARKIMRFLRRCRHRMKELKQSKEVESLQKRGLAT
ncbi:calmodulin-binding transcription activator 2 isoform X2 [Malaclemys terrapin pileata]|uniref:calmodulin-binding transcription activator 2 isoform X2 n=1 Tax=Malaclemys terrapin pileata TaxID=2991368 RepID=UPI0023A7D1ED|nr:calmodulin-binding transcription activator 2 isoform X2 [Malaclemys terrapin pileata]